MLTDSLIGLVTAVLVTDLCVMTVRIRSKQNEIIRQKITESEEHYEFAVRGIPACVISAPEENEESEETGDSCLSSS